MPRLILFVFALSSCEPRDKTEKYIIKTVWLDHTTSRLLVGAPSNCAVDPTWWFAFKDKLYYTIMDF